VGPRPAPEPHLFQDRNGAAATAGSRDDEARMVVGLLQLLLAIPGAMSLKDKRRAIRSLKDRLGARHNISLAEVDHLDEHRRSVVAIVMVSNDRRFTESCLSKIVDEVRNHRLVSILDYGVEWL